MCGNQSPQPINATSTQGRAAFFRTAAFLVLIALWSGTASASVVRAVSVEDLAVGADLVVRGRVLTLEARLVDEGRKIATMVRVIVGEAYKGQPEESVEILLPGGTHGDLVQTVRGMPEFLVGDEVVLFLRSRPVVAASVLPRRFTLVSMGLGAFFVEGSEAIRRAPGLEVITGPLDRPRVLPVQERAMPLIELEKRVRSALGESGQ